MNRAARSYAKRLGPRLAEDYGGSEFYTMGQVDTAVENLDLDTKYLAIAYAAFLPKDEYEDYFRGLENRFSYSEARIIYLHYKPVILHSRGGGNRSEYTAYGRW